MRRAKEGDVAAFDRLISEVRSSACAIATRLVGPDLAEDVVQEATLKALRSIGTLAAAGAFRSWFSRIVARCSYDLLRQQKALSSEELLEFEPDRRSPDEHTIITSHRVSDVLARIHSPDLAKVLALRELDGLSYQEIAERLDIPVGTVRSRLHKARNAFRELYHQQ